MGAHPLICRFRKANRGLSACTAMRKAMIAIQPACAEIFCPSVVCSKEERFEVMKAREGVNGYFFDS